MEAITVYDFDREAGIALCIALCKIVDLSLFLSMRLAGFARRYGLAIGDDGS